MPRVTANGAELNYEVAGKGPSLLLIHGGGVDGGTFKKLAAVLASDFTLVTYDRRGLSRSPRPTNWSQTSIAEQAEDAAGLLRALGVAPAAVLGQSLGALIALELLLRHPELVRRAILLDPGPIDIAVPDRREKMALLPENEAIRTGIATGGPEAGFEALLRGLGAWDAMDPESRRRVRGNAEIFFNYETPLLQSYRPDHGLLNGNRVPVQVAAGSETPPVFSEMAEWLATRLKVRVVTSPGGHVGYLNHPDEVAHLIRPFLLDKPQESFR
ncbi:MAG: alpha/beta hydrolase [Chloroflexota bacterium]|nr:alpha/beta hydrolase [Chloroflexota bacterium]